MIIKRFIYLSNDNDNEHFYFCQNLNIIIEKIDFVYLYQFHVSKKKENRCANS